MNVIMVSMDTVRADHLSCLGYGRPTTPNIDAAAAQGALFSACFASDVPTQPSHTSVFTGRYGINHGIVAHFWPGAVFDADIPWLPQVMEAAGFTTAAVDNLVNMKDWFVRGYEYYLKPRGRTRATGDTVNRLALPWIKEHAGDDFFLFIHYWDAHIPYQPPASYRDRFTAGLPRQDPVELHRLLAVSPTYELFQERHYSLLGEIPSLDHVSALYDAEVAYLDDHVGELLRHLDTLGIAEETMIVFFGDHGENMAEHEAWWDHAGLYDSVVNVPLMIRWPGSLPASRQDGLVQLIDIMPTVCEAAGIPIPAGVDGRSLLPLMRGEATVDRPGIPLSECTWQAKRGWRTRDWKYIRNYDAGAYGHTENELYDLAADPAEQRNVAQSRPDVAARMDAALQEWLDRELAGRPDPMLPVLQSELPGVSWLNFWTAEKAKREAGLAAF
ncbi:MAG: sulfatase [Candidatus Dormibacteria bacterium]